MAVDTNAINVDPLEPRRELFNSGLLIGQCVIAHVEIAEKKARTVPGVSGDDFRPFFQILREANYQGALSIEGKWSDAQLAPAFTEIGKQAGEV